LYELVRTGTCWLACCAGARVALLELGAVELCPAAAELTPLVPGVLTVVVAGRAETAAGNRCMGGTEMRGNRATGTFSVGIATTGAGAVIAALIDAASTARYGRLSAMMPISPNQNFW